VGDRGLVMAYIRRYDLIGIELPKKEKLMDDISRSCDLLRGGNSKKGNLMAYVRNIYCPKNPQKSRINYQNYQKRKY
jgi:hypothetical protein